MLLARTGEGGTAGAHEDRPARQANDRREDRRMIALGLDAPLPVRGPQGNAVMELFAQGGARGGRRVAGGVNRGRSRDRLGQRAAHADAPVPDAPMPDAGALPTIGAVPDVGGPVVGLSRASPAQHERQLQRRQKQAPEQRGAGHSGGHHLGAAGSIVTDLGKPTRRPFPFRDDAEAEQSARWPTVRQFLVYVILHVRTMRT